MEIYQHLQDTAESSSDMDLVIENLSEFAGSGACGICTCSTIADYVVGYVN